MKAKSGLHHQCQFFTTDTDSSFSWFPIDHFFFAPYKRDSAGKLIQDENNKIVHLEGHASVSTTSGFSVTVNYRDNESKWKSEEYDTYPQALRRMADLIEAHEKT